jgi:ribosomal protein L11 methyltransferase
MKWIELTVNTTDEGTEAVYAMLDEAGVSSVVIEQSKESVGAFLKETAQYWDFADPDEIVKNSGPCVKAYLADIPENTKLLETIRRRIEELKTVDLGIDPGSLEIFVRSVDDEDWANNWKAYYKPIPIGERLLVKPSWENVSDTGGRIVVELDPGAVFGTGSHQTTRLCMQMLEKTVKGSDNVLDLGCGSGILMITALLLGAKKAVGVDIDPAALHIVKENAAMNGIDPDRFNVYIGDAVRDRTVIQTVSEQTYDIVLANIVADVIIGLTPLTARVIKPGGKFITSGIISDRLDDVLNALKENGFDPYGIEHMDDWAAILSKRI